MSSIQNILQGEVKTLERWAEDVQERLGTDHFQFKLIRTYVHEEDLITICVFKVESSVQSREVKKVIREEADKYRQGRLYFMGYNDIAGVMFLQFYSFHLERRDSPMENDNEE